MLCTPNIPRSDGRSGSSTLVRDHLERLCATAFTTTEFKERLGRNMAIADQWLQLSANRMAVTLSQRIPELTESKAVLLDMDVMTRLRRTPLALDLYSYA